MDYFPVDFGGGGVSWRGAGGEIMGVGEPGHEGVEELGGGWDGG